MKGYNRNNIKISYLGEPHYYVNEKKRTVTCNLLGMLVGPTFNSDWDNINFPSPMYNIFATAYCREEDKFDIERGKRIALSKAENNMYNTAMLEVSNVAERLDFMRNACDEFAKKAIACQSHNIDYIDSLTMPAHPKYSNKPLPEKKGVIVEHIKNPNK